jgi:serine/threonine protein kinase
MATVYLALIGGDRGFRKLVALKVLRDHPGIGLDELREMFAHEARVSARCHHRNIVQIQDVCELDGKPALCMEYLDGQTYRQLKTRAVKAGGLALFEQVRILAEAAHGLHHVHTLTDYDGRPLGLVHCDVSPENVFVTYDGQVKLLDFGIAQAHGDRPRSPGFRGKLSYLAPELIRGDRVDARADVFALGAMLWEAVSVVPFSGGPSVDDLTKLRTRLEGGEANIRGVQPGAPEALATIIDRAVALDPTQRFPDAESFACALEDYLRRAGAQPSAQSLSKQITPMFERERARLRAVVEPQLQLAVRWDREHEVSSDRREPMQAFGTVQTSSEVAWDGSSQGLQTEAPLSPLPYSYSSASDTVRPRSRPRWTSIAVLALAALLGALGGSVLGWNESDSRVPSLPPPATDRGTAGDGRSQAKAPGAPSAERRAGPGAADSRHGQVHDTGSATDEATGSTPAPSLEVHSSAQGLSSAACVTTAETLRDEMRRLASAVVRSQERRVRRHERRARRRAEQCAAGQSEKCS